METEGTVTLPLDRYHQLIEVEKALTELTELSEGKQVVTFYDYIKTTHVEKYCKVYTNDEIIIELNKQKDELQGEINRLRSKSLEERYGVNQNKSFFKRILGC